MNISLKQQTKNKKSKYNFIANFLLRLMVLMFKLRPSLKKYLKNSEGWIDFSVGFKTDNGSVEQTLVFKNGKGKVLSYIPGNVDAILRFVNDKFVKEMLSITPNEMFSLILKNKMIMQGNVTYLQYFNFLVSLLLRKKHQRMLEKIRLEDLKSKKNEYKVNDPKMLEEIKERKNYRMKGKLEDKNVKFLDDPYLSKYSIEDFPRLKGFLDIHFNEKPSVCEERPYLLTEWYRKNGFETDNTGKEWFTPMRQALAFEYLMKNKKPIVAKNELLAGSSTAKEPTGTIIYPDSTGTMIWSELKTIDKRLLNSYKISDETEKKLHEIFPFWAERNFKEWVRKKYNNPISLQIDERWVFYFVWKSVGISHTIPNFPYVLKKGTEGIIKDIENKIKKKNLKAKEKQYLSSMIVALKGVNQYAENLSIETKKLAEKEADKTRKEELKKLADICKKIPMQKATTLDEAVNSIWIIWIALHMENTNTGLSLGRLDQWLQPYYESDIKNIKDKTEKEKYIKHAIEIIGSLFMRGTDHLPLTPDIGNYLFGGSSSDQAITLGGVTPDGEDAVNDMTYIMLKVTEILSIRDPNVNARFNLNKNSDTYLKRLCEVNFITAATPSMHNDNAVFKSLENKGYSIEDIRNWSATGCVEPTLSGSHMGHTGSILMNMVSALEMALNNGSHPSMKWDLGPKTGEIEKNNFKTFKNFFDAYKTQQKFLIEKAIDLNNMYAEFHAKERPTPLLSSLIDGCINKAMDVTIGGAKYNSSGSSNIGLADITDSLLVIKKLIFDEKKITFLDLKKAIDANFKGYEKIHSMVQTQVPKFGSGNKEAIKMAQEIAKFVHSVYSSHKNFRGAPYTAGFWSMSQHVAYGNLSGALPSGRPAGKAFTPGLTPEPSASNNFLDNISDVAKLNPKNLDNNIAFNVKLVPNSLDSREKTVDIMYSYVKSYFKMGGMQMQFNVVTADVLKDAMANPENYKNLLVRISGYNAYFVTLNKEMQVELIERAEFGM